MAGANAGASNRFGLTPFIVGEAGTLGAGCNYAGGAGIQQAIDDCFAAGGGVVGIRPATAPYVVNLTLRDNVDLKAYHTDGRLPPGLDHVEIQGHHTWASSSGLVSEVVCENISFSDPAFGDLFTFSPTGGSFCVFAAKNCGLTSNSGAGAGRIYVVNPDVTSAVIPVMEFVNADAGNVGIDCIGAGQMQIQVLSGSTMSASAGAGILLESGSCSLQVLYSQISAGTFALEDRTGTGSMAASFSQLFGTAAAVSFTVAGGSFNSFHNNLVGNGGNYITGTGNFFHADSVVPATHTIAGTVTETKVDWQPYASSGASASPVSVAPRGTSSFDSTQFTVTNGFVQLSGSGGMTWVDQPISTTVISGQGNFVTGVAVTLTLPAAPVQGDRVAFKDPTGNAPYVIQANAGQTLVVGNQVSGVGGTATSSQRGDAMELTFYAASNIWCANSLIGNWNVV